MHTTQEQGISQVYSYYRLILAAILCFLALYAAPLKIATSFNDPDILLITSGYLIVSLTNLIFVLWQKHAIGAKLILSMIMVDITTICCIMHLSGGVDTGLAILLLAPVAASAIFFPPLIANFVTAIASIFVIIDTLYLSFIQLNNQKDIISAGLIGLVLFTISIGTQTLSSRIRRAQTSLEEQSVEIEYLQQLNQMIVQRLRTGIIVFDGKGTAKLCNDAATSLTGLEQAPAQIKGRLRDLFLDWINNRETGNNIIQQEPGRPEIRVNFSTITDNQGDDYIAFIDDNRALSQQAQQLKLASLGRLSASIAHEIRNPLNAIRHASQLLLEDSSLDHQDHRLLEIIDNHTQRLDDIINNTLSISRRSPPVSERISLNNYIESLKEQMQESFDNRLDFDFSAPDSEVTITFDRSQLTQILSNLIDNAARYSERASGTAWVSIECRIDEHLELPILNIHDKGEGITPEDAEKVFEPFYTTDSKGTGLGLYICKELCALNQAELEYINPPEARGYFQIRFSHPDKRIIQN